MLLKSLNLQGFKSFADKVELQFGTGISVVVGPNGSGKSNISDGIRWVLGEQSVKSLRGAKMEDVIFSGTAKRRSVGMAEVSITLDNTSGYFPSQYSEITITRRLYRSGESDFLINKRSCRLKDVHELFMDTGLGREAFSIIGQGKVEEILNSRSEERRLLVEEVAGIIKHKNRKKEAAKKMAETEQHLQRINDLISELSQQLGPLEEQAEKAKLYKKRKIQLDELEVILLTNEVLRINNYIDQIQHQLQELTREQTMLETKVAKDESSYYKVKLKYAKSTEELSQMQQALFQLNSSVENLDSNIKHSNHLLNEFRSQEESHIAEVNNLREKIESTSGQLNELEEQLTQLKEQELINKDKLTLVEQEVGIKTENLIKLQTTQEELKSSLFEIASQKANQKNIITYNVNETHKLEATKEKKLNELDGLQANIIKLDQKEKEIIEKLKYWHSDTEALNKEQHLLQQKLHKYLMNQNELQKKYKEKELKLEQYLSRLTILKEMQESYEGYHSGVRAVLKKWQENKDSFPGVIGVVGDLIQVEDKYLAAIETALGGAVQNIVTKTLNAAKLAIGYLKEKQAGTCTFLPVESVKAYPRISLGEVANWPKVHGIASELVSIDDKLSGVLGYLLNRTILVEDINTAINTAKKLQYKVKVVTLAGDVISPGGALTGGSKKHKSTSLLSRNAEIENLQLLVGQYQKVINDLDIEIKDLKSDLNNLETNLKKTNEKIQTKKLVKVEMDKDKSQIEEEIIRHKNLRQTLRHEISIYNHEVKKANIDKNVAAKKYAELEQEEINAQQKIIADQTKNLDLKQELELCSNNLTEEKLNLANVTQELNHLKTQVVKLNEFYADERASLHKKEENYEAIKIKIEKLVGSLKSDDCLLAKKILEKRDQQTKVADKRNDNLLLEEEIKKLEEATKITARKISQEREKTHQFELKLARAESEKQGYINRLLENYGYNYANEVQMPNLVITKKEAKDKITDLKKQLEELGEVNLGAIEEHVRILERNNFLETQFEDLENARNTLNKVIGEMETIMEEKFGEAFSKLSQQFTIVFQKLFGGGNAELILTDEENLMETGVDIVAQPPGKKAQHLSLLSGGERALTAIALLFAVLKVKPSPFCVLDEIEASLDEANVCRFAGFLRDFSKKTQFIVISHRKGTMEIANVLYGVTMEESGVSKLVSVKLAEAAS